MPGFKNERKNEDIRRLIAGLVSDGIKDPRVGSGLVSVVRTELSGDNSHCKIYISHLEGQEAAKNAVKGLESASGLIKHEIMTRLKMKKCPELKFIADNSIERSARISEMIDELNKD
ncbi:MAG: 30S ribosome-binding factor RbfA [Oscillospiraceae bacterium]|nr:30S ribosome-binding factor RbfA [Oscillospiraceae bacterium]